MARGGKSATIADGVEAAVGSARQAVSRAIGTTADVPRKRPAAPDDRAAATAALDGTRAGAPQDR